MCFFSPSTFGFFNPYSISSLFSIATQQHNQWIRQAWKIIKYYITDFSPDLISYISLVVPSNSTKEALALVKWKVSLEVHSISLLHSWSISSINATKISSCAWPGTHCNNVGRVVGINLTSISLKGTLLQFSLSSFSHLKYPNLYNNDLFGTIPPQISNLSKLEYLDF